MGCPDQTSWQLNERHLDLDATCDATDVWRPAPNQALLYKSWNLHKHSQILTDCDIYHTGFLVLLGLPMDAGESFLLGVQLGSGLFCPSRAIGMGEPKTSKQSYLETQYILHS